MPYVVTLLPSAEKSLDRLDRKPRARVVARLVTLAADPRPAGHVKLTGQELYRIRVGDYRVLYAIHDARLVVLVVDVGHRGDVYRRL